MVKSFCSACIYFYIACSLFVGISGQPTKEEILLYSLKLLTENQTESERAFTSITELENLADENDDVYKSILRPEKDVSFLLYTKYSVDDYEELKLGDVTSVTKSRFNLSLPTKIAVHGWLSKGSADFCGEIKDGYLKADDVNVITVDWPSFRPYTLARLAVKPVAKTLAKFLDFLVSDVGVNKSSIHLMGHSLGAHIAGIAGQNMNYGPLPRITGFDPAGPLFSAGDKSSRLDSSDADFVDVIHSCGGYLGMSQPIGNLDFYPNGGTPIQPGCGFDLGICSHSRSYYYYIESLWDTRRPFLAVPCDSYSDFQNARCCSGITKMGDIINQRASGKYYLLTNASSPFALGRGSIVNPCWLEATTSLQSS